MSPQTLGFQCAVITGGGGGLGKAMAEWLISQGKKVIIVGRTEKTLKSTAQELGNNTEYYVLDTADIKAIPGFISNVLEKHPEVDCLINNAGVQRVLEINNFDLSKADNEIAINISGPVHLAMGFLPHFKTKPAATIMNVGSILGFVPFSIGTPVYNGTKAFVHFWSMTLRTQLEASAASKHIKVVEIAPPMVESDLHRDRSDPDDNKKRNNPIAMTVEEFMEVVVKGWKEDLDMIAPGLSAKPVSNWHDTFGPAYKEAAEAFQKN